VYSVLLVKSVGATRWNPESRAGAMSVKPKGRLDLNAVKAMSSAVMNWAQYQNLAGELDNVETSPVRGTYDWRSYIQEETSLARRREARANRDKKPERPAPVAPAPAPSNLYA
jgi:hypothetical protein